MPDPFPFPYYVGVDLGGTNVRAALADAHGRRLQEARRDSFAGGPAEVTLEKIREAVSEAERGILPSGENLTVAAFLHRWLAAVQSGVGMRTHESYAYHVRLHLIPEIGKRKLRQLEPMDLQRLYATLLSRGLSPKTVRNAHGVIRRALGQAVRWQLVPFNVALAADPPRAARPEYATYDAAKVRRLWRSVEGTRWKPFLVLAIKTGLRQGELLGLKWADIDLAGGALQVRRQLQRDKTFQPTKGQRSRRLDLGQLELQVLAEHKVRQDERRRGWGDAWEGQDLVFCTNRGRPLGWRDVYRDFRGILRKAGLEAIRFHDLRHTNATLLLEQGVHPKVVQERLGHSDIGVTLNTYSHVTPTMGQDAARRLDDLFGEGEEAAGEQPGGEAGEAPEG
jgi:integrase